MMLTLLRFGVKIKIGMGRGCCFDLQLKKKEEEEDDKERERKERGEVVVNYNTFKFSDEITNKHQQWNISITKSFGNNNDVSYYRWNQSLTKYFLIF